MNKILAYLLFFLAISTPSYSMTFFHEDGTPVKIEELRDGQKVHPDVCAVKVVEKGTGTGVFLSPNVVITSRHLVCRGENKKPNGAILYPTSYRDSIIPSECLYIEIQDRFYLVDRVELFEDGHEDIALLIIKDKFEALAKFRPVKASLQGTNVPQVSMMGYGMGRVVSEGERKFAELDDLHATTPQLRFRNNIKPLIGQSFTVARHPTMALRAGIAKTYRHDREYPQINILSRNVTGFSGDSGSPLLNEKDEIIGVASYGSEEITARERELHEIYSNSLRTRQYKFAAIKYALATAICCYALVMQYDTSWHGLLAFRLVAAFTLMTQVLEHVPPISLFKEHFERKNYEAVWSQKNSEFIKMIKQENKLFSSKYVGFRQDTVNWINDVILANSVTDLEKIL